MSIEYEVIIYSDESGKEPFSKFISSITTPFRARIFSRLDRVSRGNLGDVKMLGANFGEMRFHFGPGFRVYFGIHERTLIVLLHGGTKHRQNKDIEKARVFWQDYLERMVK